MRFTRALTPRGQRFWTATLAIALFAPALRLLAVAEPVSAGTLDRIRENGKLRLGFYTDARPFSYRDETGKAAGFTVALGESIAKDVKTALGLPGLAVEFVAVTRAERLDAVQQGEVELLCGPAAATLASRQAVAFSIPVFPHGIGALLRADAPAQLREVLADRKAPYRPQWRASMGQALQKRTFSAVARTPAESWLADKLDELKIVAKLVPVESFDAGVRRVLERSTDVLFGDRAILLEAAKRSQSAGDLIVLERLFTYEPLALALERGDDDFRLRVDRSLSRLYRSGAIQSLYGQFFGAPDVNTLMFYRLSAVPE